MCAATSADVTACSLEAVEAELLAAGNQIRQFKLDLQQAVAATNDEEKNDEAINEAKTTETIQRQIKEHVEHLNELKERHGEVVLAEIHRLEAAAAAASSDGTTATSPAGTAAARIQSLQNLLPSRMAKELKKKQKKNAKKQQARKERSFDTRQGVQDIPCQRKIYNLLADNQSHNKDDAHGGEDDTNSFRYHARINAKVGFSEGEPVYLTEKMDGTTMQATNSGVFKRYERRGKRRSTKQQQQTNQNHNDDDNDNDKNRNWHQLDETERYSLERVDLENRVNRHIAQAVRPYLPTFEKLADGVCIYFEAIGPHINARFAQHHFVEGEGKAEGQFVPSIQVFDLSERREGDGTKNNEVFAPFERTIELCRELGLPLVAYTLMEHLNLSDIIRRLEARPNYTEFPQVPLEGFVVRAVDRGNAAKIRVDDLANLLVVREE